jgi:hypothetical protein
VTSAPVWFNIPYLHSLTVSGDGEEKIVLNRIFRIKIWTRIRINKLNFKKFVY